MSVDLRGRSFLKLLDFTPEEIRYLIDLSKELKAKKKAGEPHRFLEGKNIVLLFEKTSTRTRCSFEVAGHDLGMGVTYLDPSGSQMGNKESIEDTARVLGRMFDGIEYRGFEQPTVELLAEFSGVPVWNGLTDQFHPTQMIADLLTIEEQKGRLAGINFSYFGDARFNMGNSLMVASAKMGMNYTACAPKAFWPEEELVENCRQIAKESGAVIRLTEDPEEGAKDADVLYTDIWVSMGEPEKAWEERIRELKDYQISSKLMKLASKDAIFMHCLPSFHDRKTSIGEMIFEKFGLSELEVTDEVFNGSQSVVFDEAENRMHTIKAIMYATLKD